MAGNDIAVTLRAVIGEFVSPLNVAKGEMQKFGVVVKEEAEAVKAASKEMSEAWRGLGEAFLAFGLIEGLKKIGEAASEAAGQVAIIANTTRNLGHQDSTDEIEASLRKLAMSAQGGGYSLEQLRNSFEQFASIGASPAQNIRLTADAAMLAAAKTLPLEHATRILTQAANGHMMMLARYVPGLKDAAGKTVDFATAMDKLEHAFHGDAEIRAQELTGALARLSAMGSAIIEGPFGAMIEKVVTGIVNALTRAVEWVGKLNPQFLEMAAIATLVVGGIAAVVLGGSALVLALGAIAAGVMSAIEAIGGIIAAFFALDPIVLAAGVVFVGLAIAIAKNMDLIRRTIDTVVSFVVNRLGEMVSMLGIAFNAMGAIAAKIPGIGDKVSGAWKAMGSAALQAGKNMQGMKTPLEDIGRAADGVWNKMKGIFASTGTNFNVGKPSLDGLGGEAKGVDPQKAIDDAITSAKEAISEYLAAAAMKVEQAQTRLDRAKAELERFDADHGGMRSESQMKSDAAARERLVTVEIQKQKALRDQIAAQMQTMQNAAAAELRLAQSLPAADKERVKHAAALTSEATKHRLEAEKLAATYVRMGGEVSKLRGTLAQIPRDLADSLRALDDIRAKLADETFKIKLDADTEQLRYSLQRDILLGHSTPESAARNAVGQAGIGVDQAQEQLNEAYAALQRYVDDLAHGAFKTLEDAMKQNAVVTLGVSTAELALQKATDDLALKQLELTNTLDAAKVKDFNAALAQIINKAGVPGLGAQVNAQTGKLEVAFNLWAALAEVIMKTKAFADVMNTVSKIVAVLAQIFDALFRPIIQDICRLLIFWINIVIDVVNALGSLLRIFGIHIATIEHLTANFDDLNSSMTPFIEILNNIPTLNDLAAGKTGNLPSTPTQYGNFGDFLAGMGVNGLPKASSAVRGAVSNASVASRGGGAAGSSSTNSSTSSFDGNTINVTISTPAIDKSLDLVKVGQQIAEATIQRFRTDGNALNRVPA